MWRKIDFALLLVLRLRCENNNGGKGRLAKKRKIERIFGKCFSKAKIEVASRQTTDFKKSQTRKVNKKDFYISLLSTVLHFKQFKPSLLMIYGVKRRVGEKAKKRTIFYKPFSNPENRSRKSPDLRLRF
jgi:hypothetical protein